MRGASGDFRRDPSRRARWIPARLLTKGEWVFLVVGCALFASTCAVVPTAFVHYARSANDPVVVAPGARRPVDAVAGDTMRVTGGSFRIGSDRGDADERSAQARVDSFDLDRTEVTVKAYAACVASGRCSEPGTGPYCNWVARSTKPDHPVNCVTWDQAGAFCGWAEKRLPTEAEWEYAARGQDGRTYPWGEDRPRDQLCWDGPSTTLGQGARRGTCAVGSFPEGRGPFGNLDMSGNVLEWTEDTYSPSYAAPRSGPRKVDRGGSWVSYDKADVRTTLRMRLTAEKQDFTVGFRCAR